MRLRIALGVLLIATTGCRSQQFIDRGLASSTVQANSPVTPYVQLLQTPAIAWSARTDSSAPGAAITDPELPNDFRSRRSELEAMLKAYAPRLWFHPADPFAPTDPLDFIKNASLWLKRPWGPSERIAGVGEVRPSELGQANTGIYARRMSRFWRAEGPMFSPAGFVKHAHASQSDRAPSDAGTSTANTDDEKRFFLKLEDPTQGSGLKRDWDYTSLGKDDFSKIPIKPGAVPMFWRLGKLPAGASSAAPGHERVLIEYWYHVPYSKATKWAVGNHQGDWEGMAFVVDLSLDANGKLSHKLVNAFFAAHEGGRWHCPSELQIEDGRIQAFSALGTHATYSREGEYGNTFVTDKTARGRNWDTWQLLRPMVLEPYYGFAGHWGDRKFLPHTSGPTAPGAGDKWLPNRSVAAARNLQKCI